ncbi:dTMP kinase [Vallitalea guaymasensis]|uniref:Thymidylate kinase n=1 Tax=Vallitalea guaymasensis TaxID=1185412 RepID=A0A8J8SC54_9FIRM|nr:dTMP kinase [Vallitalea guaymasensis]QUH29377.1 dTMP kinase [Vallitalea guaymasensis]
MKGLFISIEGADGSGKSTQIEKLKSYLENHNYEFVFTREPGGTVISESIRDIILNKDFMEMSDMTEALLYAASRAQHVEQYIKPLLDEGKIVICDRFVDSSVVYQGHARGLGIDNVEQINKYATGGLEPDITILLDIDAEEGLKRKKDQRELDRLELQKLDFHKKTCEGYRKLAELHSHRIKIIDASESVENIHREIINTIEHIINNRYNYNK